MTMLDIIAWHKKKFPLATPESQLKHLMQEVKEFEEAKSVDNAINELADINIIALSLQRWKDYYDYSEDVLSLYYYCYPENFKPVINQAVLDKIKVVDNREYFWNGEDYDRIR